jgi:hypothetical protein
MTTQTILSVKRLGDWLNEYINDNDLTATLANVYYLANNILYYKADHRDFKNAVYFSPLLVELKVDCNIIATIQRDEITELLGQNALIKFHETRSRQLAVCGNIRVNILTVDLTRRQFISPNLGILIEYYECSNDQPIDLDMMEKADELAVKYENEPPIKRIY